MALAPYAAISKTRIEKAKAVPLMALAVASYLMFRNQPASAAVRLERAR
jgi:hypothetical protein